jgi:hypothetical protein
MALGDLVMPRHGDYISDRTPTEAIDPDPALGCPWCTVPYAWPCTCASQCGNPACVAAVRHG